MLHGRSWFRSGVARRAVLLPVRKAVLVDVNIVEERSIQLLREHVRVLAVASAAINDDRQRLLRRILPLVEELREFVVDVGLPHRVRPRAGDVSLLVNRGAAGVEEERAVIVERFDVVVRDLDVGLLFVRGEFGERVRRRGGACCPGGGRFGGRRGRVWGDGCQGGGEFGGWWG